jgi:predicted MPP superfamily phosphohydrolase
VGGLAAASASLLGYGALTSDQIRFERRRISLPHWPSSHDGFRIGLIADLHIRPDGETVRVCREACNWLASEKPDITVIAGDLIAMWKPGVLELLSEALEPLRPVKGHVLAVPGNHDYLMGTPDLMGPFLKERGIRLLRNQAVVRHGVSFIGIDSATSGLAMPYRTIRRAKVDLPTIVLWHESDYADYLPKGLDLMLAGHSHGGQFCAPWGWPPMTALGGSKYLRGLYSQPDVPVYVSRGLGTTGPPSRLFCPAEAAILTLVPGFGSPARSSG